MLRTPESKTLFWRSSWCGGRGCWWCSSRISSMGTSLPFGGEESPLTALLQCGQEPSDRKDGRLPATLRAGGGTHRPCINCSNTSVPLQHGTSDLVLLRCIVSCYSSDVLEKMSEKPRRRLWRIPTDRREGSFRPLRPPCSGQIHARGVARTPFRTVSRRGFLRTTPRSATKHRDCEAEFEQRTMNSR